MDLSGRRPRTPYGLASLYFAHERFHLKGIRSELLEIAALWSVYLTRRLRHKVEIDRRDMSWLMVLLKATRDAGKRKDDNVVDACGYLELAGRKGEAVRKVPLRSSFVASVPDDDGEIVSDVG